MNKSFQEKMEVFESFISESKGKKMLEIVNKIKELRAKKADLLKSIGVEKRARINKHGVRSPKDLRRLINDYKWTKGKLYAAKYDLYSIRKWGKII